MSMQPKIIEIDPAGDTLFILRNPNAPFAVDSSFRKWDTALPQHWTAYQRMNEETLRFLAVAEETLSFLALAEAPDADSAPEIHMRLSSKHLTLSSTYFQNLAANGWEETKAEGGYSYRATAEEWDEEALIILMNIIHGQTQKVPLEASLEKLAKIAVLVDYYGCQKAVDFYAKVWTSRLQPSLPVTYSRGLLMRLLVSYVFSEEDAFKKLTKIIIYESRGRIHTLGLPIPKKLIDALDKNRQQLVSGFISDLNSLETRLSKEEKECSFECLSMSLGALIKGMRAMGLHDRQPTEPFNGYSVMAMETALGSIKIPEYILPLRHEMIFSLGKATTGSAGPTNPETFSSNSKKTLCSLEHKTKIIINFQLAKLQGLQLESFASKID